MNESQNILYCESSIRTIAIAETQGSITKKQTQVLTQYYSIIAVQYIKNQGNTRLSITIKKTIA
jgi:hypothetical protein